MTIVTNVPSSQTATVEDVMNLGVCVHCRKPIAGHIETVDGDVKVWKGCDPAADPELPQSAGHPLRRATDIVIMVPLTILHDAVRTAVMPTSQHDDRAARAVESKVQVQVTRKPRSGQRYSTRGKPAGRYVAIPNKPPTRMTESINRVWFAMKGNKRGIVAKDLAERLGMSDGTLAWVLAQLQKQGSVVHVRPGESLPQDVRAAS